MKEAYFMLLWFLSVGSFAAGAILVLSSIGFVIIFGFKDFVKLFILRIISGICLFIMGGILFDYLNSII